MSSLLLVERKLVSLFHRLTTNDCASNYSHPPELRVNSLPLFFVELMVTRNTIFYKKGYPGKGMTLKQDCYDETDGDGSKTSEIISCVIEDIGRQGQLLPTTFTGN